MIGFGLVSLMDLIISIFFVDWTDWDKFGLI